MLRYQVRGENLEITQAIREYVENKVSKLEKYFADSLQANVYANAKVYKNNKKKIEITVPLKGVTLRAEETNEDLYAAIDLVVDKLERQMRKYKTRINRKGREKGFVEETSLDFGKVKQLKVETMTRDEAVFQMELLGHDFFVFLDANTNEISIVYKRRDTGYGVLEISK